MKTAALINMFFSVFFLNNLHSAEMPKKIQELKIENIDQLEKCFKLNVNEKKQQGNATTYVSYDERQVESFCQLRIQPSFYTKAQDLGTVVEVLRGFDIDPIPTAKKYVEKSSDKKICEDTAMFELVTSSLLSPGRYGKEQDTIANAFGLMDVCLVNAQFKEDMQEIAAKDPNVWADKQEPIVLVCDHLREKKLVKTCIEKK